MRLEKIILNGFKSFADKTEFNFNCPITGVVGPNGCGKSNIVDAVKWVLGEQSVKSLRSGHMSDVIFSGSSSRKGVGAAEVTLVLCNTTGQLPIEADQVQISRKIYKSGESEYRINTKICRLKDIRELFMDTGVGVRAYSIIEQGQVEQLLNATKSDRRLIFEEAAGISKYKAHKKEASRKLDRTEQNLLRLADILGEVQKQLRSVKYQAGKARNYLQHTEKLKELQVNYSLAEYHKITSASSEKKASLEKRQEQFASIAAEASRNDALMGQLGQQIIETENQLNQSDNSLVTAQSKIDQHLQQIEFLKSRIEESQERKTSAQESLQRLREQKNRFDTDLNQYEGDLERGQKQLSEKETKLQQAQQAIGELNRECVRLEADLEDEKSGIIDVVRKTAQLHNEIQSISVYRSNLSNQKDRLFGRANTAKTELEKYLTEKAQYQARLSDIEKILDELQQNLDTKRLKIDEINTQIEVDNKHLTQVREQKSALASELSILKDMETRREGLNTAVKTILEKRSSQNGQFEYVQSILADIVVADFEYATAIEAALEGKTDAIVVNSKSKFLADKESFKDLAGRVNFICTDQIEPFVDNVDMSKLPAVVGRAIEFVNYPSSCAELAWKLLGKTVIVNSIDAAVELAGQLPRDYKYVTLSGESLNCHGEIKLGPLGKATGLISRKSRVRQLQDCIVDITGQITELESQLEQNDQTITHLEKLYKDLRTAIYEANTEKTQADSKLDLCEQNVKRLRDEVPLISGEIDLLEGQIAQSVQKEYDSKQKLEELEVVNDQRKTRIEELEKKYAQQKELQQSHLDQLTELKVALGQAAEQNKATKQSIDALRSRIIENDAATKTAQKETENCGQQSDQCHRDILSCEAAVSELFVEKEAKQQQSRLLREKVNKLLEEQKQAQQTVREKRARQSELEEGISQLRIELGQGQVKVADLIERVEEELQIDLAEAYENYSDEDVDWQQVRDEMKELRSKIDRLGNVNLDAIDEQENLEERNQFLTDQLSDLNKSKAQLQQLINRLNKKAEKNS
jgi:chromosome segregation protein